MTAYTFGDSNMYHTDLTMGRINHRPIHQPVSLHFVFAYINITFLHMFQSKEPFIFITITDC